MGFGAGCSPGLPLTDHVGAENLTWPLCEKGLQKKVWCFGALYSGNNLPAYSYVRQGELEGPLDSLGDHRRYSDMIMPADYDSHNCKRNEGNIQTALNKYSPRSPILKAFYETCSNSKEDG
ncbi:hypothetical protein KIN20_017356 [Parelaphostrongylus tenuis]|uniref:Uncharacterized protein n=1 Tax=Parelaphostrongylus tenuis TaxID=148309 RepID=A0AAD5QNL2_PARTN|nr:hypothetical protein KIN20_017356 [Parelaphostrongylus tenuis]